MRGDEKLIQSERRLTDPAELPGRLWFNHLTYVPGVYTGYSAQPIPAVREAIEHKKWDDAEAEVLRVAAVLREEAALIYSAAAELEKAVQ